MNKRIQSIHLLRGFAIILIVASHIWPEDETSRWFIVTRLLTQDSTLIFVFISGFLFQHLISRFNYFKYLANKLVAVILPYLLVSLVASVLRIATGPPYYIHYIWHNFEGLDIWQQIGIYLYTGSALLPLWFMPMISIYFILSALFERIQRSELTLITATGISLILSFWFVRDSLLVLFNPIYMCFHFLPAYLIGQVVARFYVTTEWTRTQTSAILWILLLVTIGATSIILLLPAYFESNQMIFFQKLLLANLLFLTLEQFSLSKQLQHWLSFLAKHSFSIFFVHYFVVLALQAIASRLGLAELATGPIDWIIRLMVTLLITIPLSLPLSWVIDLGKKELKRRLNSTQIVTTRSEV